MTITDKQIRCLKSTAKAYKFADALGLYLLVKPNGTRTWYLKYRFQNKESRISFGTYPDTSLARAREKRDEARKLLKDGINPSRHRLSQLNNDEDIHTFTLIAKSWHSTNVKLWSEGHANKIMVCLERYAFPVLGNRDVKKIETCHLAQLVQSIDEKGVHDVAGRMRQYLTKIMRHAIQLGIIKYNPAYDLGGIIARAPVKHRPALPLKRLPELLRNLKGYKGRQLTRLALELTLHVFLRSSELRFARWDEFNLETRIWAVPEKRKYVKGVKFSGRGAKMQDTHLVPLSRQAVALLQQIREIAGDSVFVFPGAHSMDKPMSENTINKALRVMGYNTKTDLCGHGFRTMACGALNESGLWSKDAIERQMSHKERNGVRAAYVHSAEHLEARIEMMQWWSDYLDISRDGYVAPYYYARQQSLAG